jgi:AcrR family transcriptional regulator
MSPRTIEQNELIREGKRKHIMDAALDLFSSRGFHATSIEKIAQKASISKGLMYNYFSSKEELMRSIVVSGYEKLNEAFDPNHDGILTRDELILYINDVLSQINSNPLYWKLYFSLTMQTEVLKEYLLPLAERGQNVFSMLVNYFQRKGAENPLVEAYFFSSVMKGVSMLYLFDPNYPIKEIRKILFQRFL